MSYTGASLGSTAGYNQTALLVRRNGPWSCLTSPEGQGRGVGQLNLSLTPRQLEVQSAAREFAVAELAPLAAEVESGGGLPPGLWTRLGAAGYLGLLVPREFDGRGLDLLTAALAMEELACRCPATALTLGAHAVLATLAVRDYGSAEQRRCFLPLLAGGEAVGAFALSEPGAGSDAAALATRAVRDGPDYRLSGTKSFVTNGPQAGLVVAFARVEESPAGRPEAEDGASGDAEGTNGGTTAAGGGVTAFLVRGDAPGLKAGRPLAKLGLQGSTTAHLTFRDCRVPGCHRLGGEGRGFDVARRALAAGRTALALLAVGIVRGALEESARHARRRRQFGRSLASFELVQAKLADMQVDLHAARQLVWRACWLWDQGDRGAEVAASEAKLFAAGAAVRATREAVQIHGGYGYLESTPVARLYRAAKLCEIGEGTSEIQRLLVGTAALRQFGRRPRRGPTPGGGKRE